MESKFPRKFGKYHLLSPLAQGGMGALYLAVSGDRDLERLMVIKTVLPHLADKEYVARFRDEAKVVVKLSHGNLIPVFDAGLVAGELFVAMDFVEGRDLRAVWNRCAKKAVAFPVDVAVYLVKELARGLGYAHSFGNLKLVHRDVSPPNVLVSYLGEIKLTDFGLASSTLKLEKTAPGIIYGKVAYMSPEQARGEPLDGRSDLYAAGIILWELLTGRQLFPPSKDQPSDLLERAKNPVIVPPSKRAPRVPPKLDAICLKALAPDKEDRYATGKELREALSAWLASEAPATDAARVEAFVTSLFAEEIKRERAERQAQLKRWRDGLTAPPSQKPGSMQVVADRSIGRRSDDLGEPVQDRRQRGGRRSHDDAAGNLAVVDVPRAAPGGRTVVRGSAQAQMVDEETMAEADPQAVIGHILERRYQIQELIGEGGMGRVYLAEHVDIGKRVAVKILHPVYGRMPELVERFRREARAASRIGHPNIVDVTDSGTTEDGSVFFVMEYLEGVELASVIDHDGALDVGRALRIATQICRAVAAAHTARIIHRDLKPENVFLTTREGVSDFVKVLDFGIAKSGENEEARAKRLTSPGMAMGTPEYMAPEQAAGRPADARCDVYAVGAILFEMLTGSPPYEGENFMEILTKKATADPPNPATLRAGLPVDVCNLVMSAMSRDPEGRPPSMEAFEYELIKCASGRGAAVAKVLGMTDDKMISGVSQRPRPSGERTPAPMMESSTEVTPPATFAGADDSAELRAAASDLWLAQRSLTRSPVVTVAWVLLAVAIAVGLGVVVFVASGERAGRKSKAAAALGGIEAPAAAKVSPRSDDRDRAPRRAPETHRTERPAEHVQPRRTTINASEKVTSSGPPRTRKAAQEILDQADSELASGDFATAHKHYAQVASGHHEKARAYLGLAKVAFEQGNEKQVIVQARKALDAGAGNEARMFLGHAYFKRRDFAQAIKLYEAILRTDPDNIEAKKAIEKARRHL
ncbi:MAG TPA: protein kinase [Kofleriaceae bacterium]|nr:protein kinase [Kofleriaceae bacterium]